MSKINFTKVEEALTEQLLKMNIEQLYHLAKASKKVKEGAKTSPLHVLTEEDQETLKALQNNMRRLHFKNRTVFKKLKIHIDEINKLFDNPDQLTEQDWEKIRELQSTIDPHLRKIAPQPKPSTSSDENLVEAERLRHINKRFNVKESWLPLK